MRRSPVFLVPLVAAAAACHDPVRPTFPGSDLDSLGPEIEIISPPADTTVSRPDVLLITVAFHDQSPVDSVTATITGALAFAFPPIPVDDTVFTVQFPIPTENATPGAGVIAIDAVDRLKNRSVRNLPFVVQ